MDGEPRLLDTEPVRPYVETRPTGVNRHGVVIGYRMSDYSSFHTDAWVYRNGRSTLLPGLTATDDVDGTVLGHLGGRPGETPYIWPPRGAPYPLIAPPGIDYAGAVAIRNGWVVGHGQQGDNTSQFFGEPVVWAGC